jgi:murein DD-endopeptidase MepM/ murein hydrolase activator NlpD
MKPFLYQPTYPFIITQRFGENPNHPVYGYGPGGHPGIDLRAKPNTPIYCALAGRVERANIDAQRGLNVDVLSQVGDEFIVHKYFHGNALKCKEGDIVKTGQLIMLSGATGNTTGPHLHFEVEEEDASGKLLNGNNGHFGRLDPERLLLPHPALKYSLLTQLVSLYTAVLRKLGG